MADKRGRPPVDATARVPSADVHLTLAAKEYDRALELAKAHRESIQDLLRRSLTRLLTDERG